MRQRAAESDVVIVNHHLLCADAAVRQSAFGEVIPACSYAIVDEAHQLEDVATQYFGIAVSTYRVEDLRARRGARGRRRGWIGDRDRARRAASTAIERVRDRARIVLQRRSQMIALARPGRRAAESRDARRPVTLLDRRARRARRRSRSGGSSAGTSETVALDAGRRRPEDDPARWRAAPRELRNDLRFLLRADDAEYVYFVEIRGRGVFLRASPIDVSRHRPRAAARPDAHDRADVGDADASTAASTTSAAGSASAGATKSGCRRSSTSRGRRSSTCRRRMPDPRSPRVRRGGGARGRSRSCKRTRGRAFVLFTSYATLRAVQQLAEMALDYPILVQGTAPRSALLTRVPTTPNAVLFATSSFWQGVDVVGEALSCVIIDKLPFASPGDPDHGGAHRGDQRARAASRSASTRSRWPSSRSSRGSAGSSGTGRTAACSPFSIPRLRTMGYGRRFLASLPPAPVTHDLEATREVLRCGSAAEARTASRGYDAPARDRPRPLLKWAGGKAAAAARAAAASTPADLHALFRAVSRQRRGLPRSAQRGLLVGREVRLSDINADVIGCYRTVRDRSSQVIAALRGLEDGHREGGREHFYEVRDRALQPVAPRDPASDRSGGRYTPSLAAMLIFLNRTGFNGLFRRQCERRVQRAGGRLRQSVRSAMRTIFSPGRGAGAIRACRSRSAAFDSALAAVDRGDFVYLDPPYAPLSGTARFTSYTAGGFDPDEQAPAAAGSRRARAAAPTCCSATRRRRRSTALYDDATDAGSGRRLATRTVPRGGRSTPSRRRGAGTWKYLITNVKVAD